ncbi:MAG: peptide-methionine (S)-S-oxide reductase MsrA [Deltaproteobacteria bacterium]|nr:peptide-methionine (S)-S-oxide reductase MsrA [Deltaproteobacteria bacterium]
MKRTLLIIIGLLVLAQGYHLFAGAYDGEADIQERKEARQNEKFERAVFAGGCFWCMQPPFDYLDGVITTTAGYTGGDEKNPTYKEVSYGKTGHTEAVEVIHDPEKVSYDTLLSVFWVNIDPTDADGQFVDRGKQYRPGIFYLNEDQKKAAMESKDKLEKSSKFDKPIVVEITQDGEFWDAEEYHQMYYKKKPMRYKTYRMGSGRDQFIDKYWRQAKN